MIVCHCAVVSDRAVDTALAEGARTLSSVCRTTGAAQDCGACIFAVKALISQRREHESAILEVEGAAS